MDKKEAYRQYKERKSYQRSECPHCRGPGSALQDGFYVCNSCVTKDGNGLYYNNNTISSYEDFEFYYNKKKVLIN